MSKAIAIATGVIIAIIAVVGCLVPLKEVPYTVMVDYEDTETYYENEPYEDIETYYVDEPYEETNEILVPLQYQVVTGGGSQSIQYCTIMNRDEVGGHFTFRQTIYVIDRDDWVDVEWEWEQGVHVDYDSDPRFTRYDLEETIYLEPNETGEVRWDAQEIDGRPREEIWVNGFGLSPVIIPEEKIVEDTVIKYRQVEKERMVTQYQEVEKERTVTKQRPETRYKKVTLLDYLLHY